jgi:hypothetical protein
MNVRLILVKFIRATRRDSIWKAPAGAIRNWASGTFRSGLSHLPGWGLVPVGKFLYKHLG